jgi:hypothetical protein
MRYLLAVAIIVASTVAIVEVVTALDRMGGALYRALRGRQIESESYRDSLDLTWAQMGTKTLRNLLPKQAKPSVHAAASVFSVGTNGHKTLRTSAISFVSPRRPRAAQPLLEPVASCR